MLVNRLCFSAEKPQPIQHVRFSLWPNAHTYAQGHRIALTLSAVDFPTFKPDTEPAVTRILAGSRVLIPVQS
jgi:predicted acyl esterase